ncbi:hypothetical protein TUM19329_26030 [Legionella antarctica]|uniref:Uncharacterized protein n=1 Tax=Legionella antarctica TaxID=2708020 RepID=A0A6F8T880_9GAMM|nr:hypothetical protein [Legionella antarctica]BCA96242.1 hypothetical protein TUM19329_26030 [Legionella antarctica]
MARFFKNKLIHPVDTTSIIEPTQNYIAEEKDKIIKDLDLIKQSLHNLTVEMLNYEKPEKNIVSIKKSDISEYNSQFNEILELMREFSVTLSKFNKVTINRAKTLCDNLPDKIAYLKNHHTIDALRSTFDFFTDARTEINSAARQFDMGPHVWNKIKEK